MHNNYEELMKMIENNKSLYRIHNIAFRLKDKNGSLVLPFSPYKMPTQSEFIPEEKVVTDIKFNQTNILNILYGKTKIYDQQKIRILQECLRKKMSITKIKYILSLCLV